MAKSSYLANMSLPDRILKSHSKNVHIFMDKSSQLANTSLPDRIYERILCHIQK